MNTTTNVQHYELQKQKFIENKASTIEDWIMLDFWWHALSHKEQAQTIQLEPRIIRQ